MSAGTEGHTMHGGGHIERPGAFYRYRDGLMRCGLTVASWQLTDQLEDDGGFAVVPGSHKGNIKPPPGLVDATDRMGVLTQVVAPAGSLVIFTEALLQ